MHGRDDKNNSSMWRTMIICALLLVILLLAGAKLFSAGYLWPILIVALILIHFWTMLRGHRPQNREHDDDSEQKNNVVNQTSAAQSAHEGHKNDKQKCHGGCCR